MTQKKAKDIVRMKYSHRAMERILEGLFLVVMAGCSSQPLHELGMKQIQDGAYGEGLKSLKQSAESSPTNIAFRADYFRERERVLAKLKGDAAGLVNKGDWDAAEEVYKRIIEIDAESAVAKDGIALINRNKRHTDAINDTKDAIEQSSYSRAEKKLHPVLVENSRNEEAQSLVEEIKKGKNGGDLADQSPEVALPREKLITLQFRDANLKMIFEAISKSSGVNILLDKDIKNELKASLFVKQASVEDTLSLLLMQNQLEKKIINDNTIFIYPATPVKLKDYQDLVIRVFQLANADAKQMQTLLKGVLKAKDIYVNEKTNSVIMRDTPDVVALAAKLIASQDVSEPEVILEIEVIEISLDKLAQIGLVYPDQMTLSIGKASQAAGTGSTPTPAVTGGLSLNDLKHLNSSSFQILTAAGGINLVANLKAQDSDTNLLSSPKIRVKQHEKAKIHIGDRVPLITNTVTPVTTGTPVVTGTVQYIDVGLKLEVEPDIHSDGEVGIKTSLEVSSIANTVTNSVSGSVAYQIGTRNVNTVLKLKDGETQVLAGLISEQEMKSRVKVPGLGDIPLIGRLFSSNSTDKKKTEIILAITPHIVRNIQQPNTELSEYWSGTDNVVRTKPITTQKMNVMKIETGVGVMDSNQAIKPGAQNPGLPENGIIRPSNTIRRPGSVAPQQGVIIPTEQDGAKGDSGVLPVERSPEMPAVPVVPVVPIAPAVPTAPVAPAPAPAPASTSVAPLVQQNDLGSSGMSDAVLYSPVGK